MSTYGQLEIIKSNGQIEFFTLDPGKGITNIGRHPENDVVLSSPGVAPFHAMLDHRQKPYQIMLLAQDGRTFVGGEALLPNVSKAVHSWTNIQLDGFTIVVVDSSGQHPAAGRAGGYYQTQPQGYGYAPPPVSRPETPSALPVRVRPARRSTATACRFPGRRR